jgi:diguanylate cyclase (GGDEF)-like protein
VAVCAVLLVVVTALRIAVSNPVEAVGFLYVIPISLAAVEFGWRGGVATAAAAMLLTVFWAVLQSVPLGVIGYAARGATFASIGLLVGVQAELRRALWEERERLMQELRAAALRDQLTGLANRRAWDERFAYDLATASRSARPLSVAVIDLDELKHVNDTHGHAHGDRVIQRCAQAWRGAVRDTDFIARLGGDEFLVLLPDCPTSDAGTSLSACSMRWRQCTRSRLASRLGTVRRTPRSSSAERTGRCTLPRRRAGRRSRSLQTLRGANA